MSDQASRLPSRPSLEQLRKQAKELLRAYRGGDSSAIAQLRAAKPGLSSPDGQHPATLGDAQFALAKEYGFESWPKLKRHILVTRRPADYHEPTWGRSTWDFFMAIYEGHEDRVREMLRDDPSLARAEYAYLQPLHYAVKAERIRMVELLLAAGSNSMGHLIPQPAPPRLKPVGVGGMSAGRMGVGAPARRPTVPPDYPRLPGVLQRERANLPASPSLVLE